MDTDSDKPFVCTFRGCNQRFANNDHLVSHSNKHELSLKLGGQGNAVLLVDQTPTPTRFLRNCEETGLFQELGNPFEHDFKHATNKISGDDEDSPGTSRSNSSSSDVTAVNPSQLSSTSVPVAPPPSLVNPQRSIPLASAPAHVLTNSSAFAKQKLLETIQNKQQLHNSGLVGAGDDPNEHHSSDMGSDYFQVPQSFPRRRGRKPDEEEPEIKRQKFLERNRAAASRCRARKKQWVDGLEKKSKEMEVLNTSLQQEVIMLKSEVQQLKSIILAHKDCPLMSGHQTKQDEAAAAAVVAAGNLNNINNNTVGVTLLSQLQSFTNLSPLMASPPSATLLQSPLFLSSIASTASSSLDVGKNVEVSGEHNEQ